MFKLDFAHVCRLLVFKKTPNNLVTQKNLFPDPIQNSFFFSLLVEHTKIFTVLSAPCNFTKVVYKKMQAKITKYTPTANALRILYYTNYIQLLKIVF